MTMGERFLGGASESEVVSLETELGVALPAPYREFLREHGAGIVGSTEIHGLGATKPGPPNVRWLLANLERLGFQRPRGLLPIAALGNGEYAALVCEPVAQAPVGSVVYWRPAKNAALEVQPVAPSFEAFLQAHRRA